MTTSKVAIAIDIVDWPKVDMLVNNIASKHKVYDRESSGNTYRCIYWDDVVWYSSAAVALEKALADMRHAIVRISEDGNIDSYYSEQDDRGEDATFAELLSWSADICFWGENAPLTPVSPYNLKYKHYMPISRERAIQILSSYVENDLNAAEQGYIYDALTSAGADHSEIEALGFGICIPDNEPKKCCICGDPIIGYGNDPWPVNLDNHAKCCDICNINTVLPARLKGMRKEA